MPLNTGQLQAVRHGEGPAMVLAGPGSGKTLVTTRRIRKLIETDGVDPARIMVLTFTRSAAEEMRERFIRLMGGASLPVTFGTFHSAYYRILRAAYPYTAGSVASQEQRSVILRQALRETDWQPEEEGELAGGLLGEISMVKGERLDISGYYSQNCPEEVFRQIYRSYERQMSEAGLIDYDDMIGMVYELFVKRPDILAAWQKRYTHFLVDEFQDINRLQYQILRMLALPENNLFVVGDDDQSIYRFRGARPEIMLGFFTDYPDAARMLLDVNYRSVPSVVDASGRLIARNENRFRKKIRAEQREDTPVRVEEWADPLTQNDGVIRAARKYHSLGIPYEEMAVLTRTNAGGRMLAEQLIRLNIPFTMEDTAPNLYEHWISRDVLTYLLMAAGSRSRGDFLRILNRPKRYISRELLAEPEISFESLRRAAGEKDWLLEKLDRLEYDLRMLAKMSPWAGVNYIRKGIGYEDYLKEYAEYRHTGLEELLAVLDELQESAQPFATLGEWMAHMAEYARTLREQKQQGGREKKGLQLLTMHGAKGLEFTVVFLLDANEGNMPHRRSALASEVEEERRLFYVAMTRAKRYLHICYVRERFHREMAPSRFVKETGLVPIQQWK